MKLSQMTSAQVIAEMSIAGNPEKMGEMMQAMLGILSDTVDATNPAELLNADLVLQRLRAEVKVWAKHLEQRTGQKVDL